MNTDSDRSLNEPSGLTTKDESSSYALEAGTAPGHDMTPEEETRMVRKLDLHIFPIVVCLYLMSFLDRVNIGKLFYGQALIRTNGLKRRASVRKKETQC